MTNISLDKSTLRKIKAGNQKAFREAYDAYHKRVFAMGLKFLKSEELAKEVVQDVFIKIWRNRTNIDLTKNFEVYLISICRNHIINLLRKASTHKKILHTIFINQSLIEETTLNTVLYKEFQNFTDDAIASLPPRRKQIFIMCKMEGKSYEEVAQAFHLSKGTIKDHMVKALKTIKEYLRQKAELNIDF